jgi:hypothetical protein
MAQPIARTRQRIDQALIALDLSRPPSLAPEQRAGITPWFPGRTDDLRPTTSASSRLCEQRGGAFVLPVLGDEGGSDSGWLVIRPRYDDGDGSQPPALLPSCPPHQPYAGGAPVVLVAQQTSQLQEVARCC